MKFTYRVGCRQADVQWYRIFVALAW